MACVLFRLGCSDLSLAETGTAISKHQAASVVTIGNFDGVHLGHQQLIARVVSRARELGARATVVSFYPHPAEVISPRGKVGRLTTTRQKLNILGALGVESLCMVHFTKALSALSAEQFILALLRNRLNATELIIGPDARFGRGREGTPDIVRQLAQKFGCGLAVVPFEEVGNAVISSRRIRGLLDAGEVAQAATLLGRPYTMRTRVRRGQGKGAGLGFPTANATLGAQIVPLNGVYATKSLLAGQWHPSVTNIGVRPSFGGTSLQVETHLINFESRPLYGQALEIAFIERLREEKRFASLDQLSEQIRQDVAKAKLLLI